MPDYDAGFKVILGDDDELASALLFIAGFPEIVADCIGNAQFMFSVNYCKNATKLDKINLKKWLSETKKLETIFWINGFFFKTYGTIPGIVLYGSCNGKSVYAKARLDSSNENAQLAQKLETMYNSESMSTSDYRFPVECVPYLRAKK